MIDRHHLVHLSGLLGSLLAAALAALVVRRARTRRGARDEEVGA
jgi:hypothetical protein